MCVCVCGCGCGRVCVVRGGPWDMEGMVRVQSIETTVNAQQQAIFCSGFWYNFKIITAAWTCRITKQTGNMTD
jgi:hypothetical protein